MFTERGTKLNSIWLVEYVMCVLIDCVFLFMQEEEVRDNRTVSICESVASTVTAPSDGEQNLSDNETRDTDDSGTASAPSPRPLDERGRVGIGSFVAIFMHLNTKIRSGVRFINISTTIFSPDFL